MVKQQQKQQQQQQQQLVEEAGGHLHIERRVNQIKYYNLVFLIFQPLGHLSDLCKEVTCRTGRECRILASGAAECVCRRKCPRRRRKQVCGSDGMIYDNHCELHREACLKGTATKLESTYVYV